MSTNQMVLNFVVQNIANKKEAQKCYASARVMSRDL